VPGLLDLGMGTTYLLHLKEMLIIDNRVSFSVMLMCDHYFRLLSL